MHKKHHFHFDLKIEGDPFRNKETLLVSTPSELLNKCVENSISILTWKLIVIRFSKRKRIET
jgi:hypothetical protein